MSTEALVSSVLIQLIIMIAAARLMNWVFSQLGQPGVIGETVAGLLLGRSLSIFSGFAAGLLFYQHTRFTEAWRRQVGQFVLVFFLPAFFTATGLRTNVLGLSYSEIGWLGLILTIPIVGKVLPVYAAGRVSGLDHWHSAVLGALMNTRALMVLIVLNVGYNLQVIPQNVFTMLVIMAVVTTVMTGPLLQLFLPRMGHLVTRLGEA